jgi:hypothetical protein
LLEKKTGGEHPPATDLTQHYRFRSFVQFFSELDIHKLSGDEHLESPSGFIFTYGCND